MNSIYFKVKNNIIGYLYKKIMKPILFRFDPEFVHVSFINVGNFFSKYEFTKKIMRVLFNYENNKLEQELFNIKFKNPIGLAAGFDYEGKLAGIVSDIGFGLATIGTVTNELYEGNEKPRLGRLPNSKSLMVNKGFKNLGVEETLKKLKPTNFPRGISIGKTNTLKIETQKQAVDDVISAFTAAQKYTKHFSYYELNISCPNLKGNIEFYEPVHLRELLDGLKSIDFKIPVFVKMPISKTDEEIRKMLQIISEYDYIKAVIFGNLQRNRGHETIAPEEVSKFEKGNFSGLPCQSRSDELIALAYKEYGHRFKIIGAGGIFCVEDAYRKIKLGASLLQLITGMIFEGPQIIGEINRGIIDLLKKDGFESLDEAIGKNNKIV